MNKITGGDFLQLIERALSSDPNESKLATKVITKEYRYRLPERFAKLIFQKFDQYARLDNIARPDNFLRLLNVAITSKTAARYKDKIFAVTLEALQHQNGAIRENGRKLVDNFPFLFDFNKEHETHAGEKQFTQLLLTVEGMLKQCQPRTIPAYLENAPPSIYKTLALTWHGMMMKYHLWEKLNYQERMVELDIPRLYKYDADDEPEEAYYTMSGWRKNIRRYLTVDDPQKCTQLLSIRERQAVTYLDWALSRLGQKKRKAEIMRIAKRDDSFELTRILTGMLFEKINIMEPQLSDARIMVEHQKLARAIQAIDNNVVLTSVDGLSFSRMLTGITEDQAWSAKPAKLNLLPLLQMFEWLHASIDEIVESVFKPEEAELQAAIQKLGSPQAPIDSTECRQIVHYMADWVFQSDYKTVLKKPAKQLAAILWSLFVEINPQMLIYGLDNATLAQYGGWKGVSSLLATKVDIHFLLQQNMADPSILVIDDPTILSR